MNYELPGILIEVFPEQKVSERFKKREFVVEKNEKGFIDQVKFQLVQDKTSLIDGFSIGESINVHFDIKGNKWKDNYFVNLQAWKIEKTGSTTINSQEDELPLTPPDNDAPFPDDEPDDLPF